MPTNAPRVRRFVSALVCAALGGCMVSPEISPEGTATSFAIEKKAPVYAPRTARAQKVVFDDPSKELIFAPDTPLRKFFDERSRDFNPGDVEYAKTTILGDIVETLRGRDYLSRIVREIVDRHTDALRPAEVEGKWLAELGALVQALEKKTGEQPPPTGARLDALMKELQGLAGKAPETLRGAASETQAQATSPEAKSEWLKLKPVGAMVSGLAKRVSRADVSNIIDRAKALHGELRDAHAALSLVQKVQGLSATAGQAPARLELARIRERNAALLASSLELALLKANYPDIRHEQVDDVLRAFVGEDWIPSTSVGESPNAKEVHGIWEATTLDSDPLARRAIEGLVLDLRESLKAKEFLQRAIDDAVEKRKGLFRTGTASLSALEGAQTALSEFIKKNLRTLTGSLFDDKATLWGAFLSSQAEANGPIARRITPLKPEELTTFGASLRQAVLAELANGAKLDKAMIEAFGKEGRSEYLRARSSEGLLDAVTLGLWRNWLKGHAPLQKAHEELVARMVERATKVANLKKAKADRTSAGDALAKARDEAKTGLRSLSDENQNLLNEFGAVEGAVVKILGYKSGTQSAQKQIEELNKNALDSTSLETAAFLLQMRASELGIGTQSIPSAWDDVVRSRKAVLDRIAPAKAVADKWREDIAKLDEASDVEVLKRLVGAKWTPLVEGDGIPDWQSALDRLGAATNSALGPPESDDPDKTAIRALASKLSKQMTGGDLVTAAKDKLVPRQAEVNRRGTAVVQLLKGLDPLRTAADAEAKAVKTEADASKEAQDAEDRVQAKIGSPTTKEVGSLAGGLASAIAEANQLATNDQRLEAGALHTHLFTVIRGFLESHKDSTEVAAYGKLEDPLAAGLSSFTVSSDRSEALSNISNRFVEVFAGHEDLVGSSEPILKSLLTSKSIRITLDENRARAAATFAEEFAKARGTLPTGATAEQLAEAVLKVLEKPQLVVLFGQGAINEGLARAFSLELFRAFQYRIQEAVDAERQADYDYWWLTLYPKAVPVGGRSFDGESLVEVSFADSLVPEDQYHRWLTDLGRVVSSGGSHETCDEDKRVRAATVLTNLMLVLDSSELTGKHEGIRETILEALRRFTNPGTCGQSSYSSGLTYLIRQAREELVRKALGVNWSEESRRGMEHAPRGTLEMLRERGKKDGPDTGSLDRLEYAYTAGEAAKLFSAYESSEHDGRNWTCDRVEFDRVARELAWADFGIEHIAFAALSAGEQERMLPSLVELYLNAFFPGVARFQENITPEDVEFAQRVLDHCQYEELRKGLTKNYLVPFAAWSDRNDIGNFLSLSGVENSSAALLTKRFWYLRDEREQWPSFGDERKRKEELVELDNLKDAVSRLRMAGRLSKMIEVYSGLSAGEQEGLHRLIMADIRYRPDVTPSRYLEYPQLWFWEVRLGGLRAELRKDTSQLFHSAYPAVPERERLRAEFSRDDWRLQTLVYQWIRDLWLVCKARGLLGGSGDVTYVPLRTSEDTGFLASVRRFLQGTKAAPAGDKDGEAPHAGDARVLVRLFLDRYSFLSRDAAEFLGDALPEKRSIYDWMETITSSQSLMDQLSAHLFDELYGPLFDVLWQLSQTDRHPIDAEKLKRDDYLQFLDWAKPELQQGIQIIDMLPSSRDDLVSMSVNEGGVVAELAGKVDASITYEANELAMMQRAAQSLKSALGAGDEGGRTEVPLDPADLAAGLRSGEQLTEFEDLLRSARLGRETRMNGQSLAASARGSLFGEARAAFAYSRRREYLDAAITAAGRGDNVARWVIRRSDVRSSLTTGDQRTNLAAVHSGQPNGDQPFYLLLKVPRGAVHTDWEDHRYILFNSSYSATARSNKGNELGHIDVVLKPLLWLLKPDAWKNLESSLVVSSFPFRWDVPAEGVCGEGPNKNKKDSPDALQRELIREPNLLGGRIDLDDTDKVRYSDILSMVAAESTFVRTTRSLQLGEVQAKLNSLDADSGKLNKEIQEQLLARLKDSKERYEAELKETGLDQLRTDLGKRIDEIQARIDELEKEAVQPPVSNN